MMLSPEMTLNDYPCFRALRGYLYKPLMTLMTLNGLSVYSVCSVVIY